MHHRYDLWLFFKGEEVDACGPIACKDAVLVDERAASLEPAGSQTLIHLPHQLAVVLASVRKDLDTFAWIHTDNLSRSLLCRVVS